MRRVMYRQGDLLFVKIDKIPRKGLVRIDDNIIVMGEATGHAHRLIGGELYKDWRRGEIYIVVKTTAKVVHEEHAPIILEKGFWRVIRQREYRPNGWDFVLD